MEKDLLTKYRQSFKKTPITNPDTKHHNNLLDHQFNPHCVVSSPPRTPKIHNMSIYIRRQQK